MIKVVKTFFWDFTIDIKQIILEQRSISLKL